MNDKIRLTKNTLYELYQIIVMNILMLICASVCLSIIIFKLFNNEYDKILNLVVLMFVSSIIAFAAMASSYKSILRLNVNLIKLDEAQERLKNIEDPSYTKVKDLTIFDVKEYIKNIPEDEAKGDQ